MKKRLSWSPVFPAYFQPFLLFGSLLAASSAHARCRIPKRQASHLQVYFDSLPTNFGGSNFCCSEISLWLGLFLFSFPADLSLEQKFPSLWWLVCCVELLACLLFLVKSLAAWMKSKKGWGEIEAYFQFIYISFIQEQHQGIPQSLVRVEVV